ncbi:hypothetical protein PI125_g26169 [Phytophthora idaei]|nr:hypothetical protein PI125_g26169 [Phytophthora idaei]KAG3163123.1 hypothetical protein PI126_g5695 [Phytophthora idaei]
MVCTQVVARRGRVEELEDDDRHDDDSSDSDYDFWDQIDEDPREELVRQMDALCATNTADSGPRLEPAHTNRWTASNASADVATRVTTRCNG